MPKQLLKTAALTLGVVATTIAGNANMLPVSPATKAAITIGSQVLLGLLGSWNLYRNPDNTPAAEPYAAQKDGGNEAVK